MLPKDLDCLMFGTDVYFYNLGGYVIKRKMINICDFNKHRIIFRRHSDIPWNIMCSVGMGLSKHGYGKMPPKNAYVFVL